MVLAGVQVSAEVHMLCLSYGLCTEKEETLSLLLGHYYEEDGRDYAQVDKCLILTRKDKRKDRVEISDEQLSEAITHAEKTGTKVVGWSHSHPHITVFPSHVDLRTQRTMQLLDQRFFGLIISCFNTDASGTERIQVTCFQALEDGSRTAIPLFVMPAASDTFLSADILNQLVYQLPNTLFQEERAAYQRSLALHTTSVSASPASSESARDYPATSSANGSSIMSTWLASSTVSATASPNATANTNTAPRDTATAAVATSYHAGVLIKSLALLSDKLVAPLTQLVIERHEQNLREIERLRQTKF